MEWRTLPDLCGRLTAIQDSIDGMPDTHSIAAFVRRALMDTPGIGALYVSLEGALHPHDQALEAARRAFSDAADAPASLNLAQLQIAPEFELFPAAARRLYGFLAASVQSPSIFSHYRSYFKAVAGILARSLETRRCLSGLANARSELEAHLKKDWEVLDIAEVGGWDWAPATGNCHWSQTLRRIFGRNPHRPPPDFEEFLTYVHPDDRKAVRDSYSAALKSGAPMRIEHRIVRLDGEERIVEGCARGFRDKDGRLVRIAGAIRDVTDSRREEERLRREAACARSVIEAAPDPLIVIDAEGNVADVNEAAARMFGAPREQLLKSDFASWFETSEQARSSVRAALTAEYIGDVPLSLGQPSGEPIMLQMNAALYRGVLGETAGAVASIRDVTEIRRHEEALAKLPEQMSAAMAELQQRERDTAIMAELSQTLQTCNTQDEAYPLIAAVCEKLFPWASGALALFVSPAQELSCVIKWGPAPAIMDDFFLDDCWGVRRGQLHRIDEPGKGAMCRHFEKPPSGPYMCLPLSVHGEAFGVLHLSGEAGAVIDDKVQRSFTALGDMVKLSLSNLKLRETLRFQAVRDPLTNLYNRQYLSETLGREVSRAKRRRLPLSVAILDIDYFKAFNDEHGHEAGDTVLKEVGALLRTAVRASDIACRYGGEEFLFVLPECDLMAARARVEHICHEIKHRQCVFHGQRLPPITMSAGIAQLSDEMNGEMELIACADRALYAAKGSGRDQIGM
jgi:diguanylate cyclase (GGDEF)-like protein/PAS domain S-box-containing protein